MILRWLCPFGQFGGQGRPWPRQIVPAEHLPLPALTRMFGPSHICSCSERNQPGDEALAQPGPTPQTRGAARLPPVQPFANLRLGQEDVFALLEGARNEADRRAVMAVAAALGSRALGEAELPPLRRGLVMLMRDRILGHLDRRLQAFYRGTLGPRPPADALSALEPLRPAVTDWVAAHDWEFLHGWLGLDRFGLAPDNARARLSHPVLPHTTLSICFTNHCNIACRHCGNSSGPHAKAGTMAVERMVALVSEMRGTGLDRVGLSGGEPFLYPDHVVALVAAARTVPGVAASINTNGFWGGDAQRCERLLDRMAEAGWDARSDRMRISMGAYHQEFLPPEVPLTAAEHYQRRFGAWPRIDIEVPPGDPGFAARFEADLAGRGLAGKLRIDVSLVSPHGRATALDDFSARPPSGPCNALGKMAVIADGMVHACCGWFDNNPNIRLGGGRPLRALLLQASNDPVLQVMATRPLGELFALTGRAHLAQQPYRSRCELCAAAIGCLNEEEMVALRRTLYSTQRFYPFAF